MVDPVNLTAGSDVMGLANKTVGSDAVDPANKTFGSDAVDPVNKTVGSDVVDPAYTTVGSEAVDRANTTVELHAVDVMDALNTMVGLEAVDPPGTTVGLNVMDRANSLNSVTGTNWTGSSASRRRWKRLPGYLSLERRHCCGGYSNDVLWPISWISSMVTNRQTYRTVGECFDRCASAYLKNGLLPHLKIMKCYASSFVWMWISSLPFCCCWWMIRLMDEESTAVASRWGPLVTN